MINLFCYHCGAPRLQDWTAGNKLLDSFIMESWKNTSNENDVYIQWIEYSRLRNVQEMTLLCYGCTYNNKTDWIANGSTRVALKMMISME